MRNLILSLGLLVALFSVGCSFGSFRAMTASERLCPELRPEKAKLCCDYELENVQEVAFEVKEETAIEEIFEEPVVEEVKAVELDEVATVTLAELKLEDIVKDEEAVTQGLSVSKDGFVSVDDERKLNDVAERYERYVSENTDDLFGHILYGKFLRKFDQVERATVIFHRANEIDGKLPVIKQQLGNCLAELGEYKAALPFFLSAVQLAPKESQYHYQLGEFLATFKKNFVQDGEFEATDIDRQVQDSFKRSMRLDPEQWGYKMRYAEYFYELAEPKWQEALGVWNSLEFEAEDDFSTEMIYLHQARVLTNLKRFEDARQRITYVEHPMLAQNRTELLSEIEEQLAQPQ